MEGPITDENENYEKLFINITNEKVEGNILSDKSGHQNLGFAISDYKPKFDDDTLEPKKIKTTDILRDSRKNGAF